MNKGILVMFAIFIIIAICIPILFFTQEKPAIEAQVDVFNVSLRYFSESGIPVSASVDVVSYGQIIKSFNSSLEAYTVVFLPSNASYLIYAKKDGYYTYKQQIDTYGQEKSVRKDLYFIPLANISSSSSDTLGQMSDIYIKTEVDGLSQGTIVCIRWSKNIISAIIDGSPQTDKPKRLQDKVDKCYLLGDMQDENKTIDLKFKTFSGIDENDYINVFFIDQDYNILTGSLSSEDNKNQDIGIKDINITINY